MRDRDRWLTRLARHSSSRSAQAGAYASRNTSLSRNTYWSSLDSTHPTRRVCTAHHRADATAHSSPVLHRRPQRRRRTVRELHLELRRRRRGGGGRGRARGRARSRRLTRRRCRLRARARCCRHVRRGGVRCGLALGCLHGRRIGQRHPRRRRRARDGAFRQPTARALLEQRGAPGAVHTRGSRRRQLGSIRRSRGHHRPRCRPGRRRTGRERRSRGGHWCAGRWRRCERRNEGQRGRRHHGGCGMSIHMNGCGGTGGGAGRGGGRWG